MEGVGAHGGSVGEQAQKFRRARVQDAPGLGVDLLPDAAQLHHRQSRLRRQSPDVGLQSAGAADAVTQQVSAPGRGPLSGEGLVGGHGPPLVRRQQQRGVQDHLRLPAGQVPDDPPALLFPDGQVGEAVQIAPQLRLHLLRDPWDAEGGGVGDLPPVGEITEEHRVEPAVWKDLGVPDLVAAGEDHIVGQLRRPQLLQTLEAVGGDPQMLPGKGLEPAVPGLQRPVVQGGVGVVGGAAQALGGLEEGVVLIDIVVNDLTLASQGLHRPLRGAGLEQGAVVMDMVKGHKSDLQARDFLSLTSGPGWRPGPGAPAGRPR